MTRVFDSFLCNPQLDITGPKLQLTTEILPVDFSQPTLTVGTSQGSKEVSITATFSQLTLEWTYGLYIHAYLFKKSWGQALLFYHLNDLTMTFTLPGVTLAPVAMPSSSSSQESDKEIGSGSKGIVLHKTKFLPVDLNFNQNVLKQ